MRPTVTTGNSRGGTLSRSGNTALRRERFFDPARDRRELERRAGDVPEHLVCRRLLPFLPQPAPERARVAGREPCASELLAQVRAQLRLERPRAQVLRRIEPGVDVREVVA